MANGLHDPVERGPLTLFPSSAFVHREEQQADRDELGEWNRNTCDEYQQCDVPIPGAPELQDSAKNCTVLLTEQSAGVYDRQEVRRNVQDHARDEPRERPLGAGGCAVRDAAQTARAAPICTEGYAGDCAAAGSTQYQP